MGEATSNILVVVGAEVGEFIHDLAKASTAVTSFSDKAMAAMKVMAAFTAAAGAAGAAMVTHMYHGASETIDQQAKLARAVGGSVASIQTLEYAADLAGISHETLAEASGKLNRKLGEAIVVGGSAAKELDRLGLSAKTLSKLDTDQRMAAISDRLVALHFNSAQAGAALKELGLKGNEMVAMMMDGGAQFREANAELREYGVLISDVDAAKIEAANDAWTKLNYAQKATANTLAVELSPYVQVVADYLREAKKEGGGFKDKIHEIVETGIKGFGMLGDIIQGLRVVFKGVEMVAVAFGAAVISLIEADATAVTWFLDRIVEKINFVIGKSNDLLGTAKDLIALPSESNFMTGLHDAANKTRDEVAVLGAELSTVAMQQMPGEKIKQFLEDVRRKSDEAGQAAVLARKHILDLPEQNEDQKHKENKINHIMESMRAGTEGMRAELQKRQDIVQIFQSKQLDLSKPYYTQQINDIKATELTKQAELLASFSKEKAIRAEHKAQNLERVGDDKSAQKKIVDEYNVQEVLAEQIKQSELTAVQEEAQLARAKLRKQEMDNALSVALGLGQQLMNFAQGHSRKAFEFAKAVALSSAVIDGYKSATSAWAAGMATGGPWAPAVAAAYTASSLLRTGAMIQGIRGTSFGSGGGSVSAGGSGASASVPSTGAITASASAGANAGSTMYVQGLDPNSLFTGAAVQTIAQGLLSYQKDGGKVVFNA